LDLINIDKLKSYDKEEINGELIDEEVKKIKFKLLGFFNKVYNIIVYIRGLSNHVKY
jgi:hypothetical protein